ncbi:uncharacterized protein N7515_003683 [Penicillium bovifimosum]|uniref:Uncharacterized protein n=1 Tax=Penicillium bovifimosum TaxID=126998 RepID=A0A9W9H555_9EURO|nr:uncharacterized protein N7515_003683 [Penicillium bovifimosum]KAJ5138835.1 hypothetical protein N7515_003683 [Penicillium bovifimosum]
MAIAGHISPFCPAFNQRLISFEGVSRSSSPRPESRPEEGAASRGSVHVRKVVILIRWENDDIGAEENIAAYIATMGKIMDILGIQHTVHILEVKDLTPGWNLQAKIRIIFRGYVNFGDTQTEQTLLTNRSTVAMADTEHGDDNPTIQSHFFPAGINNPSTQVASDGTKNQGYNLPAIASAKMQTVKALDHESRNPRG